MGSYWVAQRRKGYLQTVDNPLKYLVGMRRFELPTPCTPCRCASQATLHPDNEK